MMLVGGHLKDIPKPHRRKFDDKRRRRKVKYDITIFSGIGSHYYASLEEENNPIWNTATDEYRGGPIGWQESWDDTECKGRWLSKQCKTVEQAQAWVRNTFRREFGTKTHRLVSKMTHRTPRWCYRDGD
jgi:hypothetical protein